MSVVSRIGAASAPWVAQYLSYSSKYLPFIVMGSLSIVSAGLCIKLKETNGTAMAETLEDFYGSEGKNNTLPVILYLKCLSKSNLQIINLITN